MQLNLKNDCQAVLFDLDGTLMDTAPDLLFALNQLRIRKSLPELTLAAAKSLMSQGSKALIHLALGTTQDDPAYNLIREEFLMIYEKNIALSTCFFPGIEEVLIHLDKQRIPWGIVTNKLTRHTTPLLKALKIDHRPQCVICGDTLSTYKPDPAPIIHACNLLKIEPKHCLFIGDSQVDVLASQAAGATPLVALYGYIAPEDNPLSWKAAGYIKSPTEVLAWIPKSSQSLR